MTQADRANQIREDIIDVLGARYLLQEAMINSGTLVKAIIAHVEAKAATHDWGEASPPKTLEFGEELNPVVMQVMRCKTCGIGRTLIKKVVGQTEPIDYRYLSAAPQEWLKTFPNTPCKG